MNAVTTSYRSVFRPGLFEGRVAVVTGGGSGIGRCTAHELAALGARVVLVGRNPDKLHTVAGEIAQDAGVAEGRVCDIRDEAAVSALVAEVLAAHGRIDALVNNAGAAPLAGIAQTTPAMLEETFAVNALGPANLIAAAWPIMAAAKSGCIVNVSTMGTQDPFPGFFAYAAAKASVNLMARSCAKEGRAVGIRAFSIAPGAVETPMLRANFNEARVPRSAALTPEAVATLIVDCIAGKHDARNGDTIFISAQTGIK